MPAIDTVQSTFMRGAITPLLRSRIDIDHFKMSLAECRNWLTMKYGGIRRRSGTRFIDWVLEEDIDKNVRLMPFVFSKKNNQAYVIEMGHLYAGFIHNQARLGIVGDELVTPYSHTDLFELHIMQSNDILFITHEDYKPNQIRRQGHLNWDMAFFVNLDGPYLPVNVTDNNVVCNPSGEVAIGTNVTCTFDTTDNINAGAGFSAPNDVGRHLRIYAGQDKWAWFVIQSVTSTKVVVAKLMDHGNGFIPGASNTPVSEDADGRVEEDEWRLGAWTDTLGWPSRCTFFESRSALGRTKSFPNTVWLSESFNIDAFGPGDEANAGLSYTIRANQSQEVMWLAEGAHLLIGTVSSARGLGASDNGGALSGDNLTQKRGSNYGSEPIQPVQVDMSTLFVSSYGRALREMSYSLSADGYETPDITVLSDHFFTAGIKKYVYAQEPDSVVWLVTNDGRLIGMTFDKAQKIVGFHEHVLGGTNTFIEDATVIPGTKMDELYLLVRRTVNGEVKRSIEMLEQSFFDQDPIDGFFVDCGATYKGAPTNDFYVPHLIGEEVEVVADGAVQPKQIVPIDGYITLRNGREAETIHVGYSYESYAETLEFALPTQLGEKFGQKVRVVSTKVDVYRSRGLIVGTQSGEEKVMQRSTTDPMGRAPALKTAKMSKIVPDSWFNHGSLYFKVTQPVPCTIKSLILKVEI